MMNLKKIKTIAFLLAVCFNISAQSGTTMQLEELESEIVKASKTIQTLKGDFIQNKLIASLGIEIESTGKFYYKKTGDKLRWEYTNPTQFVIVYANNEFKIKQFENIDSKKGANQLFAELNKIILNTLNGEITKINDFNITAFNKDEYYLMSLNPDSTEFSDILNSMEIYFRKSDYSLSMVKILESNSDVTTINFNDITSNLTISEKLFE